jgi:hypothetical protein
LPKYFIRLKDVLIVIPLWIYMCYRQNNSIVKSLVLKMKNAGMSCS